MLLVFFGGGVGYLLSLVLLTIADTASIKASSRRADWRDPSAGARFLLTVLLVIGGGVVAAALA